MNTFVMNGYLWRVEFVSPLDPMLVDRTNTRTVATTDPENYVVYLSGNLRGDFLVRVLLHEMGHVALHSFNLVDDIHRMVRPEYWIEMEEWICNFIADYGYRIFLNAYSVLGTDVFGLIPKEIEKLVA